MFDLCGDWPNLRSRTLLGPHILEWVSQPLLITQAVITWSNRASSRCLESRATMGSVFALIHMTDLVRGRLGIIIWRTLKKGTCHFDRDTHALPHSCNEDPTNVIHVYARGELLYRGRKAGGQSSLVAAEIGTSDLICDPKRSIMRVTSSPNLSANSSDIFIMLSLLLEIKSSLILSLTNLATRWALVSPEAGSRVTHPPITGLFTSLQYEPEILGHSSRNR